MTREPLQWSPQILAHDAPISMASGQVVPLNLRLKFVCASQRAYGVRVPIRVGFRWLNGEDQPQSDVGDRRTLLPHVGFNQEIGFSAKLATPRTPGTYRLRCEFSIESTDDMVKSMYADLLTAVRISAVPDIVNDWRIESNVNAQEITHALVGDGKTAWDSRVPQSRGQWVRLNLSRPRWIDGLQFLTPGNGFARGYALHISSDGSTWTELVRVPSDNVDEIRVAFAPQLVQYAQVDLLASSQTSWKIGRVLIHPAVEWRATASEFPSAAHLAIDNRADTAWSSQARQEPGMWFQLDLGTAQSVSGLELVSSPGENPAAYRIAAWKAAAMQWQVVYEEGGQRCVCPSPI